jgi:hypothetical protein
MKYAQKFDICACLKMGDGHGLRFLGKLYKHKPTRTYNPESPAGHAGHAGQRGHEGQQPLHPNPGGKTSKAKETKFYII